MTASTVRRDIYQEVTDQIIALLERGVVPWRKPWSAGSAPQNIISRKAYKGMNAFLLALRGFSSPYWLTYKQAKERGGFVRRGESGARIIFWNFIEREVKNGDETEIKAYGYLNTWTVFNLEQCEGVEAPASIQREFTPIESAERVIAAMPDKPAIFHVGGNRAFYNPARDEIHLPNREQFSPTEAYYATLFHELAHSTGHGKRLARPDLMNDEFFGSIPYSREELVAEMTAAMLCGVTGIAPAVVENSAAYLDGWLHELVSDKRMLISAAALAQRAADYIQNVQSAEQEPEEAAAA